eukprot:NODE_379_length_3104_cov_6.433658.p1 GENE.NODE_379_length_3104_cov_6.433658~~NODE_379_length_3104_cov_6.433658.p1  ORF type:complete len:745 (-),score=191.93 NODE_379_length_3104_cov_6.433658:243-2477(-)
MLLPVMLRERATSYRLSMDIAFFFNTPFPSHEVFCFHPNSNELLKALLAADFIGFHTFGYLKHFRSTVTRMFGFPTEISHIDQGGHRTKLGVFPMGVDAQAILKVMRSGEFLHYQRKYKLEGKALVLVVTKLQSAKGPTQMLATIRQFLKMMSEAERTQGQDIEFDYTLTQGVGKRVQTIIAPGTGTKSWTTRDTVFLIVAHPSSQDPGLEEEVHSMITEINGAFSSPTHQPIIYIHRSVPFEELIALYARADVCLVTPLCDGLNLVAKEFVAAKDQSVPDVVPGLLIISELTGAAQEMFDAFVVNPHDIEKVAKTLAMALEVPLEQRWLFASDMHDMIVRNDASDWARRLLKELAGVRCKVVPKARLDCISQLLRCDSTSEEGSCRFFTVGDWSVCGLKNQIRAGMELVEVDGEWISAVSIEDVLQQIAAAARGDNVALGFRQSYRLARSVALGSVPVLPASIATPFLSAAPGRKACFLDYDGTLREFTLRPEDATPTKALVEIFEAFNAREDLAVHLVSGRDCRFLTEHFGDYENFTIVAEHGYLVSNPGPQPRRFDQFNQHIHNDWMDQVLPIFTLFQQSTPGSRVEVKTSALVWHFRNVDPEYGEFKAKHLMHTLSTSVANLPCEVSRGNMIIEVASLQVKKGLVVKHFLDNARREGRPYTSTLIVGDDRTDESMFRYALEEGGGEHGGVVSVKVGRGDTYADYQVKDTTALLNFLRIIADLTDPGCISPRSPRSFQGTF